MNLSNMKQTAVDILVDEILKSGYFNPTPMYKIIFKYKVQRIKELEKEQIMDAYGQGIADEAGEILDATKDAQQYYNETYGKE